MRASDALAPLISSLLLLVGLVGLAGCASRVPPPPADAERAVLAVRVETACDAAGCLSVRYPSFPEPYVPHVQSRHATETIYFVRLSDSDGDAAPQGEIIESTHRRGAYQYLVNAKPGRYAVVAAEVQHTPAPRDDAFGSWRPRTCLLPLPAHEIAKTIVDVSPGGIELIGEFNLLDVHTEPPADPDEAQAHYIRLLYEDVWAAQSIFARALDRMANLGDRSRGLCHSDWIEFSGTDEAAVRRFGLHSDAWLAEGGWVRRSSSPVGSPPVP